MNFGFTHIKKNGLHLLTVPQFCEQGANLHCFTTKEGGVSEGHLSSLNMGYGRGDDEKNVDENIKRVLNCIGAPKQELVITKQVHGDNILKVDEVPKEVIATDGLMTDKKGMLLMSYCADCVGLLFYDPIKKVAANSHAGWKGTCKKIGAKTVEKMVNEYSCKPSNILCAIGPSIGPCHFQTHDDVVNAFNMGETDLIKKIDADKYSIDLWQLNAVQLIEQGILDENISVANECTVCNSDTYFSNRASGGKFGNMACIIGIDDK